jgi:hypothetical protein
MSSFLILEIKDGFPLRKIIRFVFLMEAHSDLCEVRNESLYIMWINLSLQNVKWNSRLFTCKQDKKYIKLIEKYINKPVYMSLGTQLENTLFTSDTPLCLHVLQDFIT